MRIALTLICFLTISCSEKVIEEDSLKLIDDVGREITVPRDVHKVLPLAASLTEVLYAIDAQDMVVGVTQNSDYPKEAFEKPIVNTWPSVNYEKIIELDPDVIFAVESLMSLQVAEKLESLGYPVYFFKYGSLEDIFNGIKKVGVLIGHEERAKDLSDSLSLRLSAICQPDSNGPRTMHLIALGPIYAHGVKSFVSDKIECAGGVNPVGQSSGLTNPQISREYILKINPQIIFGVDSVTMQHSFFDKYPELKRIDAYKSWDVYNLEDYGHSRPSPRVVQSTEFMKAIIQNWKERKHKPQN